MHKCPTAIADKNIKKGKGKYEICVNSFKEENFINYSQTQVEMENKKQRKEADKGKKGEVKGKKANCFSVIKIFFFYIYKEKN